MLNYKIIIGDNRSVPVLPSNSVHMAITSPPYFDVKPYNREDPNNIGNYKDDDYYKMVKETYKEVFRVLKTGRKFVLNAPTSYGISPIDNKRQIYRLGDKSASICEEIGFIHEATIYWNQGRSSSMSILGSFPYPGGPLIINEIEECYVLRKPGDSDYSHVNEAEREASKMSKEFIRDHIYTNWEIRPENLDTVHIAPFPVKLVEDFIKCYSFVNEIVYDPFMGSGTTLKAAKNLHRSAIGCEIGYKTTTGENWLEYVKKKIGWLDGSILDEQILYEIVYPDGSVVEDVVKSLGKVKLEEINNIERIEKFDPSYTQPVAPKPKIIMHMEKELQPKDKINEEVWKPPTDGAKQKKLF